MVSSSKLTLWSSALAVVLLAAVLSACAPAPMSPEEAAAPAAAPAPSAESTAAATESTSSGFTTGGGVGGDIFRTGMDDAGPVTFHGGGDFAVAACVECHGSDGRGGVAPAITWKALTDAGFNAATVQRAITNGRDEKGKKLSADMPRYSMSQSDMASLISFLKSLQ